ncbi:MAG: four helix bundle protein [Anaeromyxobacteraceae bacterium]
MRGPGQPGEIREIKRLAMARRLQSRRGMTFVALDRAVQLIETLRPHAASLTSRDPDLADQLRRAATSIALNLGEGRKRTGKDRLQHWKVASGSAEEARTALRVAVAWGHVEHDSVQAALGLCDELCAMLWTMTR